MYFESDFPVKVTDFAMLKINTIFVLHCIEYTDKDKEKGNNIT
jgi:hypothetical protein